VDCALPKYFLHKYKFTIASYDAYLPTFQAQTVNTVPLVTLLEGKPPGDRGIISGFDLLFRPTRATYFELFTKHPHLTAAFHPLATEER